MENRHAFTVGLWVLSIAGAVAFVLVGVPWLWPRLFPVPQSVVEEEIESEGQSSSPELPSEFAMEVLRRQLYLLHLERRVHRGPSPCGRGCHVLCPKHYNVTHPSSRP